MVLGRHMESDSAVRGHKRSRASQACGVCKRRKVRCDVAAAGVPCSNCVAHEAACTIPGRKKRVSAARDPPPAAACSHGEQRPSGDGISLRNDHTSGTSAHSPFTSSASVPLAQISVPADVAEGAGRNGDAFATVVDGDSGDHTQDRTVIYSVGNSHGAVRFVADLVAGDSSHQPQHYLASRQPQDGKSVEDLEYLRAKAVFSVPPKEVCDALVRTYFHHVHPVLPILDATTFLNHFHQYGYSNVNLLLLWSMILVATSFTEPDTLQKAGYTTRAALKRAAYERAKLLFDNGHNEDQIVLIQAAILMGHWHADAEDRFEAWHWTGIAISLCQTAGLHSGARPTARRLPHFTEARERLCRRIWWTCVVRDRWICMVKGRPLRIRLEDGDLTPAETEDMEYDLRQLPGSTQAVFFPFNHRRVARSWCKTVEISVLLGDVMIKNIRLEPCTSSASGRPSEADVLLCDWPTEDDMDSMHPLEKICTYHNRLLYYATCIAFWRPHISLSISNQDQQTSMQRRAHEQARAAAAKSNAVLEEVLDHDMVKYMKSQSISALVPPMQIHLLDCKSVTAAVRILGLHRLQLCMHVLVELMQTYPSAEFALKLFQRAYERIRSRQQNVDMTQTADPARSSPGHSPSGQLMPVDYPVSSSEEPQMSSTPISYIDDVFMSSIDFGGFDGDMSFWSGFTDTGTSLLSALTCNTSPIR